MDYQVISVRGLILFLRELVVAVADQRCFVLAASVCLFQLVAEGVPGGVWNFTFGNSQPVSKRPEGKFVEVVVCHHLITLEFAFAVQNISSGIPHFRPLSTTSRIRSSISRSALQTSISRMSPSAKLNASGESSPANFRLTSI